MYRSFLSNFYYVVTVLQGNFEELVTQLRCSQYSSVIDKLKTNYWFVRGVLIQ